MMALNSNGKRLKPRNRKGQRAPRNPEQFKPLIRKLARKAVARATSANILLEQEDVEQELTEQFLRAVQDYDNQAGKSFMNFFIQGAYWRINRIIDQLVKHNVANDTISGDTGRTVDGEEFRIWELCDSGTLSPEEELLQDRLVDEIRERLSDQACRVFDLLIDPPALLLDEFERCRGGSTRSVRMPKSYGFTFVAKVLRLNQYESAKIRREIASVISEVADYNVKGAK